MTKRLLDDKSRPVITGINNITETSMTKSTGLTKAADSETDISQQCKLTIYFIYQKIYA